MTFAHPLPWWGLALVAAAAGWLALRASSAGAGVLSRPQRATLIGLRTLVLLLLVTFLMRPVRVIPTPAGQGAIVPVLIDVSRSMSIGDAGGRSRLDEALAVANSLGATLQGRFPSEVLAFGEGVEPIAPGRAPRAVASDSDLAGALQAVRDRYRGRPLAGVAVISDGAVTAPSTLEGQRLGVPVFAIPVGAAQPVADREVLSVTVGEPLMADAVVDLVATVAARGPAREPIDLRLLADGRPVELRRISAPADGTPVRELFRVFPKADRPSVFSVDVPALPSEATADNNRVSVLTPPAGRPRRVLFIEGAPGFEHSFLTRAWQGDPGVTIDAVVRKGQNEDGADTYYVQAAGSRTDALAGGFPMTRAAVFRYDTVVLGNVNLETLARDQLAWLADFVAMRGGGLVLLGSRTFDPRGVRGTPLEPLVPFEASGGPDTVMAAAYTPGGSGALALTADGADHPIMRLATSPDDSRRRWSQVPSLVGAAQLGAARPGASVLAVAIGAGGTQHPLVVVERFGRGRVFAFTGEASFRWRMMTPATDHGYETFWRQALRWASAGATDPVAVTAASSGRGADVHVTVRDESYAPVSDATVRVRATGPGGRTEELTATLDEPATGTFRARVSPASTGVYRIDADAVRGTRAIGSATGYWLAGGTNREMADPRRNDALLARLARDTGGKLLTAATLGEMPGLLKTGSVGAPPLEQRDLWHNAWTLLLVTTLLGVEWALRRRWGLR